MSDQDEPKSEETVNTEPNPSDTTSQELDLTAVVQKVMGELRRDDGSPKYEDPAKAIESLPHKEKFINELKEENKEIKEQLALALERLDKTERTSKVIESLEKKMQPETKDEKPSNQVSPDDISEQVLAKLEAKQKQQAEQANLTAFLEAVKDSGYSDVEKAISELADKQGIGSKWLLSLAQENPKAALTLTGLTNKTEAPEKINSSVNTDAYRKAQPNELKYPGLYARSGDKMSYIKQKRAELEAKLK